LEFICLIDDNLLQLNRLDIGEGFVLSVVKANFSSKPTKPTESLLAQSQVDWPDLETVCKGLEIPSLESPLVVVCNAFDVSCSDLLDIEVSLRCSKLLVLALF